MNTVYGLETHSQYVLHSSISVKNMAASYVATVEKPVAEDNIHRHNSRQTTSSRVSLSSSAPTNVKDVFTAVTIRPISAEGGDKRSMSTCPAAFKFSGVSSRSCYISWLSRRPRTALPHGGGYVGTPRRPKHGSCLSRMRCSPSLSDPGHLGTRVYSTTVCCHVTRSLLSFSDKAYLRPNPSGS